MKIETQSDVVRLVWRIQWWFMLVCCSVFAVLSLFFMNAWSLGYDLVCCGAAVYFLWGRRK